MSGAPASQPTPFEENNFFLKITCILQYATCHPVITRSFLLSLSGVFWKGDIHKSRLRSVSRPTGICCVDTFVAATPYISRARRRGPATLRWTLRPQWHLCDHHFTPESKSHVFRQHTAILQRKPIVQQILVLYSPGMIPLLVFNASSVLDGRASAAVEPLGGGGEIELSINLSISYTN